MKLSKFAAIGLVVAMGFGAASCDQDKADDASADAPKGTAAQTNAGAADDGEAAAATAEGDAELPFRATGPVAKIGDKEIPAEEFNEEVERMVQMMPFLPPAQMMSYKDKVLDNVVARHLVEGAIADAGVEVPAAEVDKEFSEFKTRLDENAPGGSKAFFEQSGKTADEFKEELRKSLAVKEILSKTHDIDVSDADAKQHYDQNKKQFDQPEQVKASHILLKVEKDADDAKVKEVEKKAKDLAKQAKKKDADFAALAREHSEGPTGPKGGDLGFFPKGKMVPEFDKVAYSLKPGEVSDPVRTQFGWHVIKVVEKKEGGMVPFDEAKDMIVAQLQEPKLRGAMTEFIEKRKAEVEVKKMPENIKDNEEMKKQAQQKPGGGMQMPPGHPPGNMKDMKLKMGGGQK